jgi:glycosyltransferase involved in cell wall biosynthesis
MKILMIVPEPFFSPRGTPFSVYYRTQTLGALGHEIDIVTYPLGRDVDLPRTRIYRSWKVPFINRVKVGPSAAKLTLDVFLFWKALVMLARGNYDAVHAHEEAVFFCLAYKRLFPKLRLVYDMHSSLPQQLKNFAFSRSRWLIRLFAFLEKRAIREASAVITICPELQKTVESLGLGTPSVLIENSLFDEIAYRDRGDEIPDALVNWRRFEGRKVVLYTGTFEHYQGIPLLLSAARRVLSLAPEALFVLIGGAPAQLSAMREQSERLGLRDGVIFTGIMHPNTVKRFIRRADVLVSPRMTGSNSPLKLYEYISSGRPLVATNLGTHTQILTDKEAVLVECAPEALAAGILSVLNQPERGQALARKARELYDKAYGRAAYAEKLQKTLLYLAGAPGPEAALHAAARKS